MEKDKFDEIYSLCRAAVSSPGVSKKFEILKHSSDIKKLISQGYTRAHIWKTLVKDKQTECGLQYFQNVVKKEILPQLKKKEKPNNNSTDSFDEKEETKVEKNGGKHPEKKLRSSIKKSSRDTLDKPSEEDVPKKFSVNSEVQS